jgi:hypothetical protein
VVTVFGREDDRSWVQKQVLDVGQPYFGSAVALDGRLAVVGSAPDDAAGRVYAIRIR